MKRAMVIALGAVLVAAASTLLLWPRSKANAQINADGCSCSRPVLAGTGREQLSVYYCVCPAMQCVVTATSAGATVPPNVVQSCGAAGQSFPGR